MTVSDQEGIGLRPSKERRELQFIFAMASKAPTKIAATMKMVVQGPDLTQWE